MDQESGNRRRSSRLAARGVATTPKPEIVVKKSLKSTEKPKRSKRKTSEEASETSISKKTKTEEKKSSKALDEEKEKEINDVSTDVPMDVDNIESTVLTSSNVETNDKPEVEEKTDAPLQDSKDQEVIEKTSVTTNDEKKDSTSLPIDKMEKPQATEEPEIKEEPADEKEVTEPKETKSTEQLTNNVSQEEPKQQDPVLENGNDKNDGEKVVQSAEENEKSDTTNATKDVTTTPNGNDFDDDDKPYTGDDPNEIEFELIYNNSIKHALQGTIPDISICTCPLKNESTAAHVEKQETTKDIGNAVDNTKNVSADDNVDQPSTVVS